jgi:hypothetical protein
VNSCASPCTITVNTTTTVNGEHASALADLANAIGHKVQVQADKQGNSWVASKVTLEGAAGDDTHTPKTDATPEATHGVEGSKTPEPEGSPEPTHGAGD